MAFKNASSLVRWYATENVRIANPARRAPFTSFAAVDPERGKDEPVPSVRTVFSSRWVQQDQEFLYEIRGNGFLHHMVRNLVGTFLLVGKSTLKPEDVTRILAAHDRSAAGATAPASGLCLVNVEY